MLRPLNSLSFRALLPVLVLAGIPVLAEESDLGLGDFDPPDAARIWSGVIAGEDPPYSGSFRVAERDNQPHLLRVDLRMTLSDGQHFNMQLEGTHTPPANEDPPLFGIKKTAFHDGTTMQRKIWEDIGHPGSFVYQPRSWAIDGVVLDEEAQTLSFPANRLEEFFLIAHYIRGTYAGRYMAALGPDIYRLYISPKGITLTPRLGEQDRLTLVGRDFSEAMLDALPREDGQGMRLVLHFPQLGFESVNHTEDRNLQRLRTTILQPHPGGVTLVLDPDKKEGVTFLPAATAFADFSRRHLRPDASERVLIERHTLARATIEDAVWTHTTRHPVDPELADDYSPLATAADKGDVAQIRLLLEQGNDPNHHYKDWTALHEACQDGHAEIARLLLDAGADLRIRTPQNTPLISATKGRHHEIVELLLEHGADPNDFDPDIRTALHVAVEKNDTYLVKLLIDAGADPNFPDHRNVSPRAMAAEAGHNSLLRLLDAAPAATGP
jgi:hypothetical protein